MDDAFGARLKEHRRRAGLTQQALARVAQLSVSAIARLEQGGRPTLATVAALAGALGVPVRVLAPPTSVQTNPPRTN
jgi:transcriptional regulator with XRE-family HTH domain